MSNDEVHRALDEVKQRRKRMEELEREADILTPLIISTVIDSTPEPGGFGDTPTQFDGFGGGTSGGGGAEGSF